MRTALLFLLLLLASPALAQTKFTSGDCNANITISGGGLTLTSTQAGTFVGCRASLGKQSGLLYYEATLHHAPVATSFGIGAGGFANGVSTAKSYTFSTAAGGDTTRNAGTFTAGDNSAAAAIRGDGASRWNNTTKTSGGALASGKTIGFAVNLNTNPWEFWTTPDVTGTSGFGGGPLWNGGANSSPTRPGTGNPIGVFPSGATAGTGFSFFIPGGAVWPIWQGQVLDSATFNFGATPFVGSRPSGYAAWNNSSGNLAYPGPLNPLKVNVSNAPGWQATHAYVVGNRVNAGAGWSGSAYTSGSAVCLFGVVTGGTSGSSASAFNTACASGTPSNIGGIPGGSWPGATTVTDGGVTWALLTRVDYATLTNAFNDEATTWATSTEYPGLQYIRNAGNIYVNLVLFAPQRTCTSASSGSGPTGTSPATDGTCHWVYLSPLTYSSNSNIWPHMKVYDNATVWQQMGYNYNPTVTVWYGGSAQQTYGPQQPGEGSPLLEALHLDFLGDHDVYCAHGYGIATSGTTGCGRVFATITVAPGDSFADNFTSSTPLRIDQTNGVTVANTAAWKGGSGNFLQSGGEPIAFSDSQVAVNGFQLLSTNGNNVDCHAFNGPGTQHCNNLQFTNDIIQSGVNGPGGFFCDGGCALLNSIVISGSTASGAIGVQFGYQNNIIANTTVVGTGAANSTCVSDQDYFSPGQPGNFYNNFCSGFSFPWSHRSGGAAWPAVPGASNATDAPAGGYGGTFTNAIGVASISLQMPGVNTSSGCGAGLTSPCSGLAAANQLVNPTIGPSFDARIKSTAADIYGAGTNYSVPRTNTLLDGSLPSPVLDVIGQTWSPRWGIGPEKFGTAAPAAGPRRP